MKKIFLFLLFCLCLVSCSFAYNGSLDIIYTGETHAMIYPCSCPIEPDGGIARRATLVKELRSKNPDSLLLDSGGFFGGGLMDTYTQNTQLDKERTLINLEAIELMQYDAVAVGDDELNFGLEFFQDAAKKFKINLVSSNMHADNVKAYSIKEIQGLRVGIIGVTTLQAAPKAPGVNFTEPLTALKEAVVALKKEKAGIIILLSHIDENDAIEIVKDIPEINIVVVGHSRIKEDVLSRVGSTLIVRPAWQGRRLGKLNLTIKENKIVDYKSEEIRLSSGISDSPDVLKFLPKCFADSNCKKEGLVGTCQNPGSADSQCLFSQPNKISFSVIEPKDCTTCNSSPFIEAMKKQFPGLDVTYIKYPDPKSEKLIKEFDIKGLPVYLFAKDIENEKGFDRLSKNMELKGDLYLVKPEFSGFSYFLGRKKDKGKFDLFISLYDNNAFGILDAVRDFIPSLHFLVYDKEGKLDAAKGKAEVEESLRSVCVQKYYPKYFWDYLSCRVRDINSTWWDACLKEGTQSDKIKQCALGQEGAELLKENIKLNKDLGVMFGPTFLIDDQEIFGMAGVPTKDELKKILGK